MERLPNTLPVSNSELQIHVRYPGPIFHFKIVLLYNSTLSHFSDLKLNYLDLQILCSYLSILLSSYLYQDLDP